MLPLTNLKLLRLSLRKTSGKSVLFPVNGLTDKKEKRNKLEYQLDCIVDIEKNNCVHK